MISNMSLTSVFGDEWAGSSPEQQIINEDVEEDPIPVPSPPYDPADEVRRREEAFEQILNASSVDLAELRSLAWQGVPSKYRAPVWQLLLGYAPTHLSRRPQLLERRRAEYQELAAQHCNPERLHPGDPLYKQILLDVPRTCPDVQLFKEPAVRDSLVRILYCWSVRRPASGYVQGINDLLTPLYDVFLSDCDGGGDEQVLGRVEADCFWCFSKLVDSIQDCFTPNQAGIFRQLSRLNSLIARTDPQLLAHLEGIELHPAQFAFRWINCMLVREFPLHLIIRLWDTYLAEAEDGFADFNTYVCAALMTRWSAELQKMDFTEALLFLQALPTERWSLRDLEVLLSEAYVLKSLFHNATL